jgi:hypothetical protein
MGDRTNRSTFCWPRHLLEVSGQIHAPVALPQGKEPPLPIGQEVGWTPEPVCMTCTRENSWPYRDSNSDSSVVQTVASSAIENRLSNCLEGEENQESLCRVDRLQDLPHAPLTSNQQSGKQKYMGVSLTYVLLLYWYNTNYETVIHVNNI